MRTWRKVHIFSFGYFKIVSLISSILILFIAITGILYNHSYDFSFLEKSRVPTKFLPGKYQERIDTTREAQGLGNLFKEEANSVPIMWIVIDLHNGEFFGEFWGRILYDIIAISLAVLAITGIYMYFKIRRRSVF